MSLWQHSAPVEYCVQVILLLPVVGSAGNSLSSITKRKKCIFRRAGNVNFELFQFLDFMTGL
jgi:hypothetical protein